MILKNVRRSEDGDYEFDMAASEDEVSFLMTLAMHMLITAGAVQLQEEVEEQEVSLPIPNGEDTTLLQ